MRALVAGIGNIFLGDDGFGVEVVRRLRDRPLDEAVDVVDYGIRGVHLAFALADGNYDAAILVDAVARGGEPGTLYAIEPDGNVDPIDAAAADAHSLTPDAVLAWVKQIGGRLPRIVIVGCEPATTEERMELSPPVAASVDRAIEMVKKLIIELYDRDRAGAPAFAKATAGPPKLGRDDEHSRSARRTASASD